jgi:uncharacterized protein
MNRPIENPKYIQLSELPDDGRDYTYTSESGELTEALEDVLQDNSYQINLYLEKLGNAYQATGTIQTHLSRQCSRCGADISLPVNLSVKEILMIHPEMPRSGKNAKVNHSTELDPLSPDCVILHKPELNVGEFLREIVVVNEPIRPLCSKPCENPYLANHQGAEPDLANSEMSPFSVLKDLKLNS